MKSVKVKEIRKTTGLTQKAFASMFDIPLRTLQKWEQGEASPAPYIVSLIIKALPGSDIGVREIAGRDGEIYYYDPERKTVSDARGNSIRIHEDLDEVKDQNLVVYLEDLFWDFYEIQNRFDRDCRYDKNSDAIWTHERR